MADLPFQLQDGIKAVLRQALQFSLFLRKCFGDHAVGRAMDPDIGHGNQPFDQLGIEILEIAEVAAQEEILTDIADGVDGSRSRHRNAKM